FYATGIALQLSASVLHRFIVGGRLLEAPRRALAARLSPNIAPMGTPVGIKLLWAAASPTLSALALLWAALRSAVPTLVALAVLTAILAAQDFARSAERLAVSTERLAAGDMSEPVAIASDDEVGRIAAALRMLSDTVRRGAGAAGESMTTMGRHVAAVAGGAA